MLVGLLPDGCEKHNMSGGVKEKVLLLFVTHCVSKQYFRCFYKQCVAISIYDVGKQKGDLSDVERSPSVISSVMIWLYISKFCEIRRLSQHRISLAVYHILQHISLLHLQ